MLLYLLYSFYVILSHCVLAIFAVWSNRDQLRPSSIKRNQDRNEKKVYSSFLHRTQYYKKVSPTAILTFQIFFSRLQNFEERQFLATYIKPIPISFFPRSSWFLSVQCSPLWLSTRNKAQLLYSAVFCVEILSTFYWISNPTQALSQVNYSQFYCDT